MESSLSRRTKLRKRTIETAPTVFHHPIYGRVCVSNLTHLENSLLFNADLFLPLPIEPLLVCPALYFSPDPDLIQLDQTNPALRFTGTAYRAANWRYVGLTKGRGKLEKHHQAVLPQKAIFLYPLRPDFKEILTR